MCVNCENSIGEVNFVKPVNKNSAKNEVDLLTVSVALSTILENFSVMDRALLFEGLGGADVCKLV